MIQRLCIHNFRCLENFELKAKGLYSALLIVKNGLCKSSVGDALEVLQKIGKGMYRTRDFLKMSDFVYWQQDQPIRIEVEVLLDGKLFHYDLMT